MNASAASLNLNTVIMTFTELTRLSDWDSRALESWKPTPIFLRHPPLVRPRPHPGRAVCLFHAQGGSSMRRHYLSLVPQFLPSTCAFVFLSVYERARCACVCVCVCVCARARVRVCSWDTQESGRGMFNRLQAPVACSICGVEIQAPIVPTPSSPSLAPPEQAALVAASSNCRFQPATPIDSRTVRGMRDPRGCVFLTRMSGLQ